MISIVKMSFLSRLEAGKVDSFTFDKRYLRKDGRYVWANITTRPLTNATGATVCVLTSVLDISERKKSEETLKLVLNALRALVSYVKSGPAGID